MAIGLRALCTAFFALPSHALSLSSATAISSRQVDSNIASSLLLRRGYHASAVLDDVVYIDGGELSYTSGGSTIWQYSSDLLAISLDEDWTNATVHISSVSKVGGAPNLINGGIWVDSVNRTFYTGFCGTWSSFGDAAFVPNGIWQFTPTSKGTTGTWKNLNDTASSAFRTDIRPNSCSVAAGNGTGYSLAGLVGDFDSQREYNISGLISYDYATGAATNTTVTGVLTDGVVQHGAMIFVPHFGPAGVVIAMGGTQLGKEKAATDDLLSMETVQILDPASGKWYEQPVTGDIPRPRKEFCIAGVASDEDTFEIFLYGGWGGKWGASALPYDEAFVLTLPGFYWVRADYQERSPRHALTCESVGGGQILTIGGVDPANIDPNNGYMGTFETKDPFVNGLGMFDIHSLSWIDSFSANRTVYIPSEEVHDFYKAHPRLGALNSTELRDIFAVQNFTGVPTTNHTSSSSTAGTSSSPTTATSTSTSSPSHHASNKGAIAGGVVGGVAAAALLAGAVLYLLRRRRRGETTPQATTADHVRYSLVDSAAVSTKTQDKTEMPGTGHQVYELGDGQHRHQLE